MVRAAQEKARHKGCAASVEFRCLPIERLGSTDTGALFDGVLSNFGSNRAVICRLSRAPWLLS